MLGLKLNHVSKRGPWSLYPVALNNFMPYGMINLDNTVFMQCAQKLQARSSQDIDKESHGNVLMHRWLSASLWYLSAEPSICNYLPLYISRSSSHWNKTQQTSIIILSKLHVDQATKVWLSCYLVLLSWLQNQVTRQPHLRDLTHIDVLEVHFQGYTGSHVIQALNSSLAAEQIWSPPQVTFHLSWFVGFSD